MAHIRRGFSKALGAGERDAARIIYLISYLYHIEDWVRMSNQNKKSGPALRDAIRASHCAPRLKLIEKYLRKIQSRHLPKSLMGKAITYAMNQWSGLESYLKDGRVELDNNLCENTIRPLKIGAKNYLFFGSRRGGELACVDYTLTETCKRHGLDLHHYLTSAMRALVEQAPQKTN